MDQGEGRKREKFETSFEKKILNATMINPLDLKALRTSKAFCAPEIWSRDSNYGSQFINLDETLSMRLSNTQ